MIQSNLEHFSSSINYSLTTTCTSTVKVEESMFWNMTNAINTHICLWFVVGTKQTQ